MEQNHLLGSLQAWVIFEVYVEWQIVYLGEYDGALFTVERIIYFDGMRYRIWFILLRIFDVWPSPLRISEIRFSWRGISSP